jgi:septal ring factor EnvC (AmiA/AmiB activator)
MHLSTSTSSIGNLPTRPAAKPSTRLTANRSKLQSLIKATAKQQAEIASLRRQIAKAHAEINALSESKSFKSLIANQDQRIAALHSANRIALRAAGLAPSRIVLDICPIGSVTNPVEAYAAAIEAGDRSGAAEIFAAHKTAIFSSRK